MMGTTAILTRSIPRAHWRSVDARSLIVLAAMLLGIEPALWLIGTWRDPAYGSNGALVFLVAAALAAWSLSSPVDGPDQSRLRARVGLGLLLTSALARLAGQILAVNSLGALCLVVDVIAAGMLLRLDVRRRALSPVWLGVTFALSLPLERIVQRTVGYPLQHLSADGACRVLGGLFENVQCMGVRIIVDARDVLVDLPCSGARTALLTLFAFAVLASVLRPGWRAILGGLVVTSLAAYAANVLRIVVLSIGLAKPSLLAGIDVMAPPWHDVIGLSALVVSLVPSILFLRRLTQHDRCTRGSAGRRPVPDCIRYDGWWIERDFRLRFRGGSSQFWNRAFGFGAVCAALFIISLPQRPLDVARQEQRLALPAWISGNPAREVSLHSRERAYFTRFGGAAAKAQYGPHGLMVVRTTSPLRHLHAPDECLRGLGFSVRYVGLAGGGLPTAVYEAHAADGAAYRVDVTFVSDRGHKVANVATAAWLWLTGEARAWRAVHRISPIDLDADRHAQWSSAALAALGIEVLRPFVRGAKAQNVFLAKGVDQ